MAEAFLKSLDSTIEVYSAGVNPEKEVNPKTIQVMKEVGIDLSKAYSKNVSKFINDSFDFVVTVCDDAMKTCPIFTGKVKKKLHLSFIDPADAKGTDKQILNEYREVRDEIKSSFYQLYYSKLKD